MELPFQDPLRVFLDDVACELSILIEQRPLSEKRGQQIGQFGHEAYDDMLVLLGAKDCSYLPVDFQRLAANTALDPKSARSDEFQMPSSPSVTLSYKFPMCAV